MVEIEETSATEDTRIQPPAPGAAWNAVEDVIFRRRSVRFYKKKPVPEYLIRRMLEAGRFAPSAGNAQPWKFIVIQDPRLIEEMTKDVVGLCQTLMRFLDYVSPGKARLEWLTKLFMRFRPQEFHPIPFGAMRLIAQGELGVWHGASTVIIILADRRSPGNPDLDAGIAGQNMVLCANSLGLATCWVSFVKPLNYKLKWRKLLGVRYPYKLVSSIAVGFPRGNPDGQVSRETQAVDWYAENGTFKVVY